MSQERSAGTHKMVPRIPSMTVLVAMKSQKRSTMAEMMVATMRQPSASKTLANKMADVAIVALGKVSAHQPL